MMNTVPKDLPELPLRPTDAHKGFFGNLLLAGGSAGMCGALVLAARAAFRTGVGRATAAMPDKSWAPVASQLVEATTLALPGTPAGLFSEAAGKSLLEASKGFSALVTGPGFGRNPEAGELVEKLLRDVELPMLLDADALFRLDTERLSRERPDMKGKRLVITPHAGEMARIMGVSARDVQANREEVAEEYSRKCAGVLLLKGKDTIITDGERTEVNDTGNPGMAAGGMGDVLSGVIGAMLAMGLEMFDAARLGAWLHGRAGDIAAEKVGMDGLTASDVVESLPAALVELRRARE